MFTTIWIIYGISWSESWTQYGCYFADGIYIFTNIFLKVQRYILIKMSEVCISTKISLKFVPKGPMNNIPALIQIMAWRRQCWLACWRIHPSLGLNELITFQEEHYWCYLSNTLHCLWLNSPWWWFLDLLSWYPIFKSSHCNSFAEWASADSAPTSSSAGGKFSNELLKLDYIMYLTGSGYEISNWMHLSVGQVDCKNHLSKCIIHLSEIYKADATHVKVINTQSSFGQVLQVFHLSDCHFYSSQTIGQVKFRTLQDTSATAPTCLLDSRSAYKMEAGPTSILYIHYY